MTADSGRLTALMADAVDHCIRHVQAGGIPFVGQLVGDDGYTSAYGVNRVRETGDSSAHAEIVAIRRSFDERGTRDLRGLRLLATGEPCGLCYRFAAEHGIASIHYAIDADTAAEHGFDYRASYTALGIDRSNPTISIEHLPVTHGLEPFNRFRERTLPETPPSPDGRQRKGTS